jgi:hypothetical protein
MSNEYDDFEPHVGGYGGGASLVDKWTESVREYPNAWFVLYAVLLIFALWSIWKWFKGESFMPTVTAMDQERDDTGANPNQMNAQGPPVVGRQGSLFVANSQEDASDAPLVLLPTSGAAVLASPDFNCQFDPTGQLLNPVTSDSHQWIGSALGVKESMTSNRMVAAMNGF